VQQRHQWKLPLYNCRDDIDSQLAQICQLPAEYDFPRVSLPQCFHYTGPLQDPSGLEPVFFPSISFPFEKLTGKPLIYASLGTLQNRKCHASISNPTGADGRFLQKAGIKLTRSNPSSWRSE
jgi:UDP:flavonoid glycosyltransferase YjiC (YdhE family)